MKESLTVSRFRADPLKDAIYQIVALLNKIAQPTEGFLFASPDVNTCMLQGQWSTAASVLGHGQVKHALCASFYSAIKLILSFFFL